MNPLRASQIAVVASLGALFTLVIFGNVTDYGTNLNFIGHVMSMDTVFPFATTRYRAVTSPTFHHAAYLLIIVTEVVANALIWRGVRRLWRARRDPAPRFAVAKGPATAGLTLGLVLWQVGLIGLGSEWFGMWMSSTWTGLDNAFRYLIMTLGALIYLQLPEAATSSATERY